MKAFLITSILLFVFGCNKNVEPVITEAHKIEMRKDVNEFMSQLKTVLISEIQNSGVVNAVAVCADTAQTITNAFGIMRGVLIKRVSFKTRNPNNIPDEFETAGLKHFEQLLIEQKLDSLTEYVQIVDAENLKYLRYMKPIIVQAPCLNCHGSEDFIMPEVKNLINSKYTYDRAKDYNIGDLRGAISIQKVL